MKWSLIFVFACLPAFGGTISRGMHRADIIKALGQPIQEQTGGAFQYLYFEDATLCQGDGRCIVTLNDKDQVLYCENFYPSRISNCGAPAYVEAVARSNANSEPDDGQFHLIKDKKWRRVLRSIFRPVKVRCETTQSGNTIETSCD